MTGQRVKLQITEKPISLTFLLPL